MFQTIINILLWQDIIVFLAMIGSPWQDHYTSSSLAHHTMQDYIYQIYRVPGHTWYTVLGLLCSWL